MQEFKRILSKKIIIIIISCVVINAGLFVYYQMGGLSFNEIKNISKEYNSLTAEFTGLDFESASQELVDRIKKDTDNGLEISQAKIKMRKKLSYLSGFSSKTNSVIERADEMQGKRLFSDKSSYSYNNIIKTAKDFGKIRDVQVKLTNDVAAESLFNYKYMYYIAAACIIAVLYECFKERENGVWQIIHCAKKGRAVLELKRYIFVWAASFFVTLLFYITTFITSICIYGWGDFFNTPVQSIEIMSSFIGRCSIAQYIGLLYITSSAVLAMLGSIFLALFTVIRNRNAVLMLSIILCGVEFLLYINIDIHSKNSILRFVNIVNFLDINNLLSEYQNWGFGKYVFSVRFILVLSVFAAAVIAFITAMVKSSRMRPFEKTGVIKKFFEKIGEFYQRILSGYCVILKEIHKLIFTGKGIVVIAVVLVLTGYICTSGKMEFTDSQKEYDEIYLAEGGKDYSDIKNEIELIQSELEKARKELSDMQEPYKNKEIPEEVFLNAVKSAEVLEYALRNKQELVSKLQYISQVKEEYGTDSWLISDRGYEQFFGRYGRTREYIITVFMITSVFLVVSRGKALEYSTGMNFIARSSANGRTWINRRRMAGSIIYTVGIVLTICIIDYICVNKMYDLPYNDAPLISLGFVGDYMGTGILAFKSVRNIVADMSIQALIIARLAVRIAIGLCAMLLAKFAGGLVAKRINAFIEPVILVALILAGIFVLNFLVIF